MEEGKQENNEKEDEDSEGNKADEEIAERASEAIKKTKEKLKKNPWRMTTAVFGVIAIVLLILTFRGGITGGAISEGDAASKLVDYLNAQTDGGVSFVSSEDLGNLYEITVSYQGREIPVHITKDGTYYVANVVPLTGQATQPSQEQQQAQDVPKSDKPRVELFIMTHCPYGTQAEKGMLPVFELLGEKIDSSIKFVHYFLHEPEETETPVQICIREEQGDKYLDYLACFLKEGDTDACLKEAKIDEAKLNSCKQNKYDDLYAVDSALSEGYGVRGSPTLVINGQEASSGRDPASYLSAICSAFNDAPDECSEELSSQSPSPGFGYSASGGSTTTAQC